MQTDTHVYSSLQTAVNKMCGVVKHLISLQFKTVFCMNLKSADMQSSITWCPGNPLTHELKIFRKDTPNSSPKVNLHEFAHRF